MKKLLFLFITLIFSIISADSVAPNYFYKKYSPNGRFLIEMTPFGKYGEKGKGIVYNVVDSVKKDSIWSINWYAYNVFLHDDGEHLIRFGPWASDKINHSDLAISFYFRNQPLKEYKVNELIKEPTRLSYSVSHYEWHAEETKIQNGFSTDFSKYTITLADKNVYVFDALNGKILENYIDKNAKNSSEVFWGEQIQAHELGEKIKDKSDDLLAFEKHFSIKDISAFNGQTFGVYINSEQWRGDIYPILKTNPIWRGELIFPINKDSLIEVGLKPEDLMNSYQDFISSKFIQQLLNTTEVNEIRIRAAGDRLHWDTKEILEYQEALKSRKYNIYDTKKWIEVTIDYDKKEMISFYRPLYGDYYILNYFTDFPVIIRKQLGLDSIKKLDFYSQSKITAKYCYDNCTMFFNNGNFKIFKKLKK